MSGSNGYQRRVRAAGAGGIVRMPDNAPADNGALGRAMMGLGETLSGAGSQLAAAQQQREERQAVADVERGLTTLPMRDKTGALIFYDLRDGNSIADRMFNRGIVQAQVDSAEVDARNRAVEMANDPALSRSPEAYRQSWDTYQREREAAAPEYLRGRMRDSLFRIGSEGWRGVTTATRNEIRGQQLALWNETLRASDDELLGFAEAGQTHGPAWENALARRNSHIQAGIASGHILAERADLLQGDMVDRLDGLRIAVQARAIATTQGPQAARRWLDERMRSPEAAAFGSRAQNLARVEGLHRIGVVEQEQSFLQGELRGKWTTVAASVRAGVTTSPAQLDRYAQQAEAAGMPQQAGQFRAMAQVQGELATVSRMALPEIMAATMAAQGGNPEDPASAMRVSELQQLTTERVNALRTDPVGFARSQPMVQDALRRAADGQGTMQDVVAAQDAVLTANGVDPVGHRIVPQAEVAQLKDAIQNKPIVGDGTPERPGAADLLAGVFRRYGSENAHRVWNDLRGAGLSEALRPVALLLTRPSQQNALRAYLEATRVGPEALRQGLGTDTSRDVREAVSTALQGLRDTDSGTGQDAQLMADAATAAQTLALVYAGQGSAKEAAQRAVADVTAGLRIVDGSLGRFRVPRGVDYDQPAFLQAMGRMLGREPQVDGSAGNRMGQRGAAGGFYGDAPPPAPGSVRPDAPPSAMSQVRFRIPPGAVSAGLTEDQQQDAFRRSLQTFGRFRTAPDGGGVWLQDDKGRPVFTEDGKPFGIRFGEERNPEGPAALRPTAPRGVRNNNPLNLEFRGQPGAAMESHQSPRFARFGSMEDGVVAATQQLVRYGERGQDSVQAIISRWAPPSENDTAAYVAQVSRAMGVQPGQQLNLRDPAVMEKLVGAMAQKENGRPLDADALRRGVARGLPS